MLCCDCVYIYKKIDIIVGNFNMYGYLYVCDMFYKIKSI